MKKRKFLACIILAVLVAFACNTRETNPPESSAQPAANVILLIGDGMGHEVLGLARMYAQTVEKREMWLEKVMSEGHLALADVTSLKKVVTDSAAAATALATGEKTLNGLVSLSPEGRELPTILELAQRNSRSAGLVTTTRITHATPACFAAHVGKRNLEATIAQQMLASGVDVLLGGGLRYWIPEGTKVSDFGAVSLVAGAHAESARKDDLNLLGKASREGYNLATNREELLAAQGAEKLLGLFAASHMPYSLDRRPDDGANVPSLAEMARAALRIVARNPKGFFLMIEGGRIDHAAHNNDIAAMIAETIDFDEAVGAAYSFAKEHPDTALFITADHCTGAAALSARYSEEAGEKLYPNGENLKRISGQDASFEYMMYALFQNPSAPELKELVHRHTGVEISEEQAMFIMSAEPISPFHVIRPIYRKYGYPMLALGRVLGVEYGVSWASAEHYAAPVLLLGYGQRSQLVRGYLDNTDVFKLMKTAAGL